MLPAADSLVLSADGIVFAGRGLLRGYALSNTHATEAMTVAFRDGTTTAAELRFQVSIVAGASAVAFPGTGAVRLERGLFLDVTGGTLVGVAYYNPETRLLHDLAMFDDGTEDLTEFGLYRLVAEIGGA